MADWTYQPTDQQIERDPPTTLITKFEQKKKDRRQKPGSTTRMFIEKHTVDGTDMAAMETFYDSKGLVTQFTKVSYDPNEAAATEATVLFTERLKFEQTGPDEFQTTIRFEEYVA